VAETDLDFILAKVPETIGYASAVKRARRALDSAAGAGGHWSWITPQALLGRIRRLQSTIRLTVGSIACLCLILGGTTLTSLMVANVRDRLAEIGLRKAIGATAADIVGLFVLEGCLVTTAAALIGTVGGHAILLAISPGLPVPIKVGLETILVPVLAAVGLGAVFSYWPARLAAKVEPSEALRNE
jgi:ABC-type antimicrobial peptide transport system permease subunit